MREMLGVYGINMGTLRPVTLMLGNYIDADIMGEDGCVVIG